MYFTITYDGNDRILEDHKSLAEAEQFARDVAGEGYDCGILETLRMFEREEQPSLEEFNGVRPGVDFPATLCSGVSHAG